MSEYDEQWGFVDVCPHGLPENQHCDTCCVDIGDAERSMRFDWGADIPEEYESLTEEWAASEASNDWSGS